jgi:hypothetical protein
MMKTNDGEMLEVEGFTFIPVERGMTSPRHLLKMDRRIG